MNLIQIFLPLQDNQGQKFPSDNFEKVRQKLIEKFGGLTAFTQSPALGLWENSEEKITRDQIIIFEIMVDELDKIWWGSYKNKLQEAFKQDEIVIRAYGIDIL